MNPLKKIASLIALLILGALNIFVYLNSHFYYRAGGVEDRKEKIAWLERSNKFFPLNDVVFYELGKAYFDLGIESLGNVAESESYFRKAVQSLKKCIRINPAPPYSHFYLGQSLLHLGLLSNGNDAGIFNEFRDAVMLAGGDQQIYNEVGKVFLSRWPDLSDEERSFTLDVLRKIKAGKDNKEIANLMSLWELNVKDYQVMEELLPSDAPIYRQYAEFLGEKSLSLEERHKYLAQAELLEFERARREYQSGENQLIHFQTQEAFRLFKISQDLLRGIKFYQTLNTENLIDNNEYSELLKSTLFGLAKCRVEEGAGWDDAKDDLRQYLVLEDRTANIDELAAYLRDRGVISEKFDKSSSEISRFAFELLLQFKQNKYREIIDFGRDLQGSFMVIPEAKKPDYIRILQLVGDSLQKADFLYDAGDIYQKALEIDPNNLETLLKIRQNYDRLNEERKLEEINKVIEKLVAPREIDLKNMLISKRQTFSRSLVFDGQKVVLGLQFQTDEKSGAPLIAVFFNNRVVWEEYLKDGVISLSLVTKAGENRLQIMPVNRTVSLTKIIYGLDNGNINMPMVRRKN
jgi:tetratricopeptide (TPR) repeat protein